MFHASKIALIASITLLSGYFVATPNPAQAGSGAPTQMVSENPPMFVQFSSFDEGEPDYEIDIAQIRVVGNKGGSFLHLQSVATGEQWLERFKDNSAIARWLQVSAKAGFKGAIPLGLSQ